MHLRLLAKAPESDDKMKEFLDEVDAVVSRLSNNGAPTGAVSTLGMVLQLTKAVVDRLSEVRNKCFRPMVSRLI